MAGDSLAMSCLTPDQPKRFCKECQLQGYPEQEIIILSTYGGRDTNVLNLDGSKHYHLFSFETYIFQHYEDDSIRDIKSARVDEKQKMRQWSTF